ncbi:MAG: helix-turn-helix transcriptional regulator [Pseudoxanthomonas sp.]
MDMQTLWADRRQSHEFAEPTAQPQGIVAMACSRGGSIAMQAQMPTFWMTLRGQAVVDSIEGQFHLKPGDWIALEPESQPVLHADDGALVLGIAIAPGARLQAHYRLGLDMQTGRGHMSRRDARLCLYLWRRVGVFKPVWGAEAKTFLPLLLRRVAGVQQEMQALADRCPGRSQRRRRYLFGRLQRARLYLEGNVDRNVRLAELAEKSNVSPWYFTKLFHALYGESPQTMAARLRLERAAELLADSTLSIGEVGMACGFENNCSFSRAFREHYGRPPSMFRRGDATCAPKMTPRMAAVRLPRST